MEWISQPIPAVAIVVAVFALSSTIVLGRWRARQREFHAAMERSEREAVRREKQIAEEARERQRKIDAESRERQRKIDAESRERQRKIDAEAGERDEQANRLMESVRTLVREVQEQAAEDRRENRRRWELTESRLDALALDLAEIKATDSQIDLTLKAIEILMRKLAGEAPSGGAADLPRLAAQQALDALGDEREE